MVESSSTKLTQIHAAPVPLLSSRWSGQILLETTSLMLFFFVVDTIAVMLFYKASNKLCLTVDPAGDRIFPEALDC